MFGGFKLVRFRSRVVHDGNEFLEVKQRYPNYNQISSFPPKPEIFGTKARIFVGHASPTVAHAAGVFQQIPAYRGETSFPFFISNKTKKITSGTQKGEKKRRRRFGYSPYIFQFFLFIVPILCVVSAFVFIRRRFFTVSPLWELQFWFSYVERCEHKKIKQKELRSTIRAARLWRPAGTRKLGKRAFHTPKLQLHGK